MIFKFSIVVLLLSTRPLFGQGLKRYQNEIFGSYQVQSNIPYGKVLAKPLYLDAYTATGDTVSQRPMVLFIHAGGFQTGDKVSGFAKLVCAAMAKRGYVAASIEYRLTSPIANDTACFEAMLRALQDAKAAVRFFRKNGALYGIDTSQIFAIGSSAGSITALHLAYLDSAEVPGFVNWNRVDNTFEGTSGNPGFSSRVQAVISNWGALGDTAWMKKGDVPVYCVHGTSDSTIYYNLIPAYGPFRFSSKYIVMAAQQKGIVNGLRLFYQAGHELNGDTIKQDSAITDFSAWLYTILKPQIVTAVQVRPLLPTSFLLLQNFPNPFNPSTVIEFQISTKEHVTLKIFDMLGREIATLVDEQKPAGKYSIRFDAGTLADRVYFYRIIAGNFVGTKKLILLK
jgi:dienelactone hydrolase